MITWVIMRKVQLTESNGNKEPARHGLPAPAAGRGDHPGPGGGMRPMKPTMSRTKGNPLAKGLGKPSAV